MRQNPLHTGGWASRAQLTTNFVWSTHKMQAHFWHSCSISHLVCRLLSCVWTFSFSVFCVLFFPLFSCEFQFRKWFFGSSSGCSENILGKYRREMCCFVFLVSGIPDPDAKHNDKFTARYVLMYVCNYSSEHTSTRSRLIGAVIISFSRSNSNKKKIMCIDNPNAMQSIEISNNSLVECGPICQFSVWI